MTRTVSTEPGIATAAAPSMWARVAFARWRFATILALLIPLAAYFAVAEPGFRTAQNVENLLSSASVTWIAAIGMTFVMIGGGFDLSLGALLALSGVVVVTLYSDAGLTSLLAVLLTIVVAGALGALVNGVLIGGAKLSFLVVTLGTSAVFQGTVNVWSGGTTRQIDSPFVTALGSGTWLIPIPIWIMLGCYAVAAFVLRFTYFGRDVYATGGNPEAARLAGINTARTIVLVYAVAAVFVAVAAVVQVGRIQSASPTIGATLALDAATAVLLGGTSFRGGVGSVTGTVVGALFLAVLQNGLALSGVQSYWSQIVSGTVLIGAIAADRAPAVRAALRRRARRAPD
jgi:ribose transport system permease protein